MAFDGVVFSDLRAPADLGRTGLVLVEAARRGVDGLGTMVSPDLPLCLRVAVQDSRVEFGARECSERGGGSGSHREYLG